MTRTTTVNLPFEGFYYSLYSDAIDQEEHREIENNTDARVVAHFTQGKISIVEEMK